MSPAPPHHLGLPFRHPAVFLATGLGVGFLPSAPGSWASLAALPLAWFVDENFGSIGLAVAASVLVAAGCWAAGRLIEAGAGKDPGAIVIDEIAGQLLTLIPAPLDPTAYALGFALFRLFDIWKPWPVRWADRKVGGGFGVMLDDILAAGYAAVVLLAIGGSIGV